ncbi:hypothetical protein BDP27DRAFT_1365591 [Rhodocollybia butyracea]|uniref:Uncharacterized protein n=1 Tax=Rhodocollybia butyracea TaxID=206335 RepID=A0A9P5PNI1_9AGAR|nr:hypothetical protein BDP27DRAFT_1365591 [Rhodocollybia butyracea]
MKYKEAAGTGKEVQGCILKGNKAPRRKQVERNGGSSTGDDITTPPFKFRALEELIAMRCQRAGTVGQPATGLSRRVEFVLRNPYSSSTSTLPVYNQPHLTLLEMSEDQHRVQCFRIHGLDMDMIIECAGIFATVQNQVKCTLCRTQTDESCKRPPLSLVCSFCHSRHKTCDYARMLRFCAYAHLEGISVAEAVEVLTPHGTGFTFPTELFCDALDIIERDNSSVEVLQRVDFERKAMFPASSEERKGLSSFIQRQQEEDPWQKTVDSEKSKRERKKDKTSKKGSGKRGTTNKSQPSIWFTIPALAKSRVPSSTATDNPVVPPFNDLPITQPESPLPTNLPQVITRKRSFSPTPDKASRVVRPRLGPAEGLDLEGQVIPATFIQAYRAAVLQLQEEKESLQRDLKEANRSFNILSYQHQEEISALESSLMEKKKEIRVLEDMVMSSVGTSSESLVRDLQSDREALVNERNVTLEYAIMLYFDLQFPHVHRLLRETSSSRVVHSLLRNAGMESMVSSIEPVFDANHTIRYGKYLKSGPDFFPLYTLKDPKSPALQKAICKLLADLDALPYTPTPTDSSVNYLPLPAPSFLPLSSTVPGLGTASRSDLLLPVSSQTPNSNPPREPSPMEEIKYVDLADIPGLHEEEDELEEEGEDELNEEVREVSQMAIREDVVIPGQEHSGGIIPEVHVQTESLFVPNPHNPLHMNAKSGF